MKPKLILFYKINSQKMINPFQTSQQPSLDYNTEPICFYQSRKKQQSQIFSSIQMPLPANTISSPIEDMVLGDSSKNSMKEFKEDCLSENCKYQSLFKQLKAYTVSLEKRNLQIAIELQRQKTKTSQLSNALTFIKQEQSLTHKQYHQKTTQNTELQQNLLQTTDKLQSLQVQYQSLKAQSIYLKDLILIANENYQKLQNKYSGISNQYNNVVKEMNQKEGQTVKKMEEIKIMFTQIVMEKGKDQGALRERKNENVKENASNYMSNKSTKKEVEDVYRQMFIKTLKNKKENQPRNT